MSLIIGIHMGHDASVTLLKDGKQLLSMSEEKLSRIKAHYGFPRKTLSYVLNKFNLTPDDIDTVAIDTFDILKLVGPEKVKLRFKEGIKPKDISSKIINAKKLLNYLVGTSTSSKKVKKTSEQAEIEFYKQMLKLGFQKDKIKFYDHHFCHATSAFYPSPFSEAIVFTSDGRGDKISATISKAKNNKIETISQVGELESIGQFYSAVTKFLGFKPLRHEGKITGLAAYGNKEKLGNKFIQRIKWNEDNTYTFELPEKYECRDINQLKEFIKTHSLDLKDKVILKDQVLRSDVLITLKWYGQLAYLKEVTAGFTKEEIAAGVQYFAEEISVEYLKRTIKEFSLPVVLAGGVFANVRINQKIREIPGVENVFVQPAMGDDGLSMGAALAAYYENASDAELKKKPDERPALLNDTFYGPSFDRSEIIDYLEKNNIKYTVSPNIEEEVGKWIHEGKIIGLFQGRLEYGPRALGHRSILVRPTDKSINNSLNKRLNRTEFMPFAPAIIAEEASNYFIDYKPNHIASEYMTITYDVVKERQAEIEAVVHVDGTARPQVVFENKEPRYYNIIKEYFKLSGIPVIINTSFNAHEEPIVFTPENAYNSFANGAVDILVLEDIVVKN
jgi:carbamoyltransferase